MLGAGASSLIDRDASKVSIQVNKDNVALISYHTSLGKVSRRVVAWGALNALPVPNASLKQESFKVQYLGATGPIHTDIVKGTFVNSCKRYTGPKLSWFVTKCENSRSLANCLPGSGAGATAAGIGGGSTGEAVPSQPALWSGARLTGTMG